MGLADQRLEHVAGVLQGVEEVHDLHAVLEALPAHVFQAHCPVDQHHHFAGAAHAAAHRLLAQQRTESINGLETGNIGRGFIVPHRMAFFIGPVLGEDAAQVNLARLGRAIGLLATPSL